jgi:signal transduction histidine kinase
MNLAGENVVERRLANAERHAWLPLSALLVALCGLVALPLVRAHYVQPLYDEMRSVTEPSRGLVTRIHVALALEGGLVQQYDNSRDATLVDRYRSAAAEEIEATEELAQLVGRLGPVARRELADMRRLQSAWHADVDRHLSGGATTKLKPLTEDHYEELLLSSARLDEALNAAAETRWRSIESSTTALRWVGLLIALVAFGASVIVAWLGRRLRLFATAAERRKTELEAARASRENLLRGITHDLKNPLHAIAGHAEMLSDGDFGQLEPRQMRSVGVIRKCVADELHLINDLLDLSQAEAGALHIRLEETDLAQVIRDVTESYAARARAAGHEMIVEISSVAGRLITDRERVKQILSNLVSNAIKYSFDGKPIRIVAMSRPRMSEKATDQWISIDVIDSGPGIPVSKKGEIFEEFSRLESSSHKPGSGLGLAIARRVARLLGGDVVADNVEEGGAIFTLWLPPNPAMAGHLRRSATG